MMVQYDIIIKGQLDKKWKDWFEGMTISALPKGETLISGFVKDQPHLHGLLNKIRDMGIPLVKVEQKEVSDISE